MNGKLVGFKRFTSKKNGQTYCVANIVMPYTPAENDRGCYGESVQEVFLPEHQIDFLTEKHIGKNVKLIYTVNRSRATLDELQVI